MRERHPREIELARLSDREDGEAVGAEMAEHLGLRGYIHGDILPVFLPPIPSLSKEDREALGIQVSPKGAWMIEVRVDLDPIPGKDNFLKTVAIKRTESGIQPLVTPGSILDHMHSIAVPSSSKPSSKTP